MGWKAAGIVVETEAAGIRAALGSAAWAFIAAARVAGIARAGASAAAGWARANDDKTTTGSAAVVTAIMGRLCLEGCFGERDVVMERILFFNCRGREMRCDY